MDANDEKLTTRRLGDRDDVRDTLCALAGHARRQIDICAAALDPYFFNTARFVDALGHFCAAHQRNRVRILTGNSERLLRDNVRLAETCRQLSDFIQIHAPGEEHGELNEMFMITDTSAFLRQPDITRHEFVLCVDDRPRTVQLRKRFDHIWERSEQIVGLHPVGL